MEGEIPPRRSPTEPAVESASAPPELCKWVFPTINYLQNNATSNKHEHPSVSKHCKGEGWGRQQYGAKGQEDWDRESLSCMAMAHLSQDICRPYANAKQRTNAKNNDPFTRLCIFTALMQNRPPCRLWHLLLRHLSQGSKNLNMQFITLKYFPRALCCLSWDFWGSEMISFVFIFEGRRRVRQRGGGARRSMPRDIPNVSVSLSSKV